MPATLEDYLAPIGAVTIAAARLEEVAIRWISLLSDDADHMATHKKVMLRGLDKNLKGLATSAAAKLAEQKTIEKIRTRVAQAIRLKDQRNENVHGVWDQMVDACGEKVRVSRSRYRAGDNFGWDPVTTPSIPELKQLATAIEDIANELNAELVHAWDHDEKLLSWRRGRGYA
jgi:hypothetical protein